jgi:type II secretion system protein G
VNAASPAIALNRPYVACRSAARRPAFTLVELLVVVVIIGMLMAIVTPAIMRVRSSAVNSKVKAEIDMLHMALMNYKNEFGSFPPAEMADLWNAATNEVNTKSQAYRHLVRLFPRLNENRRDAVSGDSPYKYMAKMSPAQALVFWLQGFYENQEYPLTNGAPWPGKGTRKKFYDFDETRLFAASALVAGKPQEYKRRNEASDDFEREYPVYMTSHLSAGLPYVYFDSRCYDNETTGDTSYRARNLFGDETIAFPYYTSTPPVNPIWTQWHVAADTFQLIAAGADGKYGSNAAAFPLSVEVRPASGSPVTIPAVTNEADAIGHQDNITNFASGPLADAAAALDKR